MENKVKNAKLVNSSSKKTALIITISILCGAALMFIAIKYLLPKSITNTVINKSEKEVTITDQGIADAVEKLYDAVVVVKVFKNDTLAGNGTGFVYKTSDDKAYILTNNHVVSGIGDKGYVTVMFTDGSEEKVKIEGSDQYSDLAVLSLDANKVKAVAEIGASETMRLGDTVFTIGAPLGTTYYWSVTRGILSGKDRMVEVNTSQSLSSDYVLNVLQTDTAINAGNSGGPLANANGEVIGITNMKLSSSSVEGIGFAIPIETAIEFADAIIKGEDVSRPYLGVSTLNLSEKYALYMNQVTLNTELTEGVVVVKTEEGSAADKAGLKKGDIITAINGVAVKDGATFRYELYNHKVGDKIKLEIERSGKNKTLEATLAASK